MKRLDALFRGGPSTPATRVTVVLPDDGPDAPLEVDDPHGGGHPWRRQTGPDERPAVYDQM